MDTENYTTNRIFFWATEILMAIISAGSLYLDVKGLYPKVDWQWIAIGAMLVFIFTAFRHIILLEGDLLSKIPKISIAIPPYLEDVQMNSGKPIIVSSKGETVNRNISKFLKIAFANTPKHNTEKNHAKRITAKLTYRDKKGNILVGPIYARWSLSDQPKNADDLKRLIFYELDSSGKIEPIDVAFKIYSEDICYAYNNDSYFHPDLKNPEFELKSNVIDVKIELSGERVNRKRIYKFRFYNDGKNVPIRIEERKSWLKRLFHKPAT
jgi:hypothetical protein